MQFIFKLKLELWDSTEWKLIKIKGSIDKGKISTMVGREMWSSDQTEQLFALAPVLKWKILYLLTETFLNLKFQSSIRGNFKCWLKLLNLTFNLRFFASRFYFLASNFHCNSTKANQCCFLCNRKEMETEKGKVIICFLKDLSNCSLSFFSTLNQGCFDL